MKTNLSTYQNILRSTIKLAKQKYYESLFNKYKKDIKNTWQTINGLLNRPNASRNFPEYFTVEGTLIHDSKGIADKFNEYFVNIGPT